MYLSPISSPSLKAGLDRPNGPTVATTGDSFVGADEDDSVVGVVATWLAAQAVIKKSKQNNKMGGILCE
jgi:hypothetical protein